MSEQLPETDYQIPRNGLAWLLAAMFSALLPHMLRLPVWVTLICLLCGVWKLMVYRGRWRGPGRLLRMLLVFGGGAAVFAHYGTLAGPDAGSALLILGFCFKLIESRTRRDAFIVVILGYFVVAVSFFFDQSILLSLYLALVCVMVTAALLGLNQSPLYTRPRRTLRLSLRLVGYSLPMLLLLFVLVPRIGPIWSLDLGQGRAKTGLSETISAGDIAQLSQSSELAFRVEFEPGSPVPAAQDRYWRALVLEHYDGRRWTRGLELDKADRVDWQSNGSRWRGPRQQGSEAGLNRYDYQVMMEPTDQPWLFALAWARSDSRGVGATRDFRLLRDKPVGHPFQYQVSSTTGLSLDAAGLPAWLRRANLQLPDTDPRTRILAQRLWRDSSDAQDYIQRVLQYFNQQNFTYTLRPPLLIGDRVDQFLFESRRGFCSHYAGAFVFLMRAAGLPARIVAGYQGGELNPLGGYLLVHQFDAHAWVEVWLPGRGWVRFDPTAWVSPERVEQGLEQAMEQEGSFLADSPLSPLRYRGSAWITQLRLGWDYLNYGWYRIMLGYDAKMQRELLSRLFDKVDLMLLATLLLSSLGAVLMGLAWLIFRRSGLRTPTDPLLKLYRGLCRRLARKGLRPESGEPPSSFVRRAATELPEQALALQRIARQFERCLYAPSADEQDPQLQRLRVQLRRLSL
ncbi:transglutaminase TgpA family protein [Motiliproteus sp.]|uniref:transglutaminase TgpA family protein n=1 Tax=Motiliproteus sp. TaxID=1898955 RepID=UPI003BABE300